MEAHDCAHNARVTEARSKVRPCWPRSAGSRGIIAVVRKSRSSARMKTMLGRRGGGVGATAVVAEGAPGEPPQAVQTETHRSGIARRADSESMHSSLLPAALVPPDQHCGHHHVRGCPLVPGAQNRTRRGEWRAQRATSPAGKALREGT